MKFFVGLHQPSAAARVRLPCCISVNALCGRKSDFSVGEWILDSGAFTSVARDGGYSEEVGAYFEQIERWSRCGHLIAAVAQDWMCEPAVIKRTGKTIREHQSLTIERYDELLMLRPPVPILPVLQGYHPTEYAAHVRQYDDRLTPAMWVGVGSICKRNSSVGSIADVLGAILAVRPDLRLHGFGLKLTALCDPHIRSLLYSADSMAWSFAARMEGRNANDWREAVAFASKIGRFKGCSGLQPTLPLWSA